MYPIELFPRQYTEDRIHMDPKLVNAVLASHDERSHGDVCSIVSLDVLRSQI
jgi:hypothetical protein